MRKACFLVLFLVLTSPRLLKAQDFYGKVDAGYGTLLEPDISDPGVRKGGFTAVFQALFGDDNLKYGAEFGTTEVYTSWNKNGIILDKSLVLIPLSGALQYEFAGRAAVPYIGVGAGPYFALESTNTGANGTGGSSSSSKVYGGASLAAGVKLKASSKLDIDLSCRYMTVNAAEHVSMFGVYAGIGANIPFFTPAKAEKISLPIKEKPEK